MRVSVIVPTRDRRDALRQCLEALASQEVPASEIVVVDDASTDGTREMLERIPWVRGLRQEEHLGPAAARNRGVAVASGELLAFTDDDCEVPGDWLRTLLEGWRRYPRAGAIGGIQEPSLEQQRRHVVARYECLVTRRVHGLGERELVGRPLPVGANNLSVRAELLRELGAFDESFPVAAGEDAELLHRLADAGYDTVCLPLSVTHRAPATWRGFLRQQVSRGVGAAWFQHRRGGVRPLPREVARLLASPLLFPRELLRYRSPSMSALRTIAGACQVWGRLRARRLVRNDTGPRTRTAVAGEHAR